MTYWQRIVVTALTFLLDQAIYREKLLDAKQSETRKPSASRFLVCNTFSIEKVVHANNRKAQCAQSNTPKEYTIQCWLVLNFSAGQFLIALGGKTK